MKRSTIQKMLQDNKFKNSWADKIVMFHGNAIKRLILEVILEILESEINKCPHCIHNLRRKKCKNCVDYSNFDYKFK